MVGLESFSIDLQRSVVAGAMESTVDDMAGDAGILLNADLSDAYPDRQRRQDSVEQITAHTKRSPTFNHRQPGRITDTDRRVSVDQKKRAIRLTLFIHATSGLIFESTFSQEIAKQKRP